ncbi:MAG: divalent-cation tolerance protein CutA [Calditrichales bacterium]|nr:MAG: divalent-cation tolerance protein CutA [Calditrichales bacterium]
MNENILIVHCTCSGDAEAKRISRKLVEKRLAACCNIIPGVTSIYSWEGKIEESQESLLLIKTTLKNYEQLEKEIKMIHSYAVPEIIALNAETGSTAYLDWIADYVEKKV